VATSEPPALPAPRRSRRPRLSKNQKIGVGLLLTLVGIFAITYLLPTAPGQLGYALAVAAVGIVALWVGGIMMGVGSRS
jgi:hypothetical protein